MRMLGAGIDAEVLELSAGQRTTRHHAADGVLEHALGETLLELMGGRRCDVDDDISIGFSTDDLDALTKQLHARGIKIHSGPFSPAPGVRFIFVQDPDGLKVQFVEQKRG